MRGLGRANDPVKTGAHGRIEVHQSSACGVVSLFWLRAHCFFFGSTRVHCMALVSHVLGPGLILEGGAAWVTLAAHFSFFSLFLFLFLFSCPPFRLLLFIYKRLATSGPLRALGFSMFSKAARPYIGKRHWCACANLPRARTGGLSLLHHPNLESTGPGSTRQADNRAESGGLPRLKGPCCC